MPPIAPFYAHFKLNSQGWSPGHHHPSPPPWEGKSLPHPPCGRLCPPQWWAIPTTTSEVHTLKCEIHTQYHQSRLKHCICVHTCVPGCQLIRSQESDTTISISYVYLFQPLQFIFHHLSSFVAYICVDLMHNTSMAQKKRSIQKTPL